LAAVPDIIAAGNMSVRRYFFASNISPDIETRLLAVNKSNNNNATQMFYCMSYFITLAYCRHVRLTLCKQVYRPSTRPKSTQKIVESLMAFADECHMR